MSPRYTTIGGYPNTDPYYVTPEEEEAMSHTSKPDREVGWLIELKSSVAATPTYYGEDGEGALGWTTDNLKAIRFARRTDAERVIALEGYTEAFACEHAWVGPDTTPHTSKSDVQREFEEAMAPRKDPAHPAFRDHNCWKCDSGKKPCPKGDQWNCGNLHARND